MDAVRLPAAATAARPCCGCEGVGLPASSTSCRTTSCRSPANFQARRFKVKPNVPRSVPPLSPSLAAAASRLANTSRHSSFSLSSSISTWPLACPSPSHAPQCDGHPQSHRVRAPQAAGPQRVAAAEPVTEGAEEAGAEVFADEQDFLKAGGPERQWVELQAAKEVEGQLRAADVLQRLETLDSQHHHDAQQQPTLDIVVVGCGPAGLALAAEIAKHGPTVGLVGRDLPFVNTYGVWPDEFQGLGLEQCIEQVWADTVLYTGSDQPIRTGRPYGRLCRTKLREELLHRCKAGGVRFLGADVDTIVDDDGTNGVGGSTIVTTEGQTIRSRLVVVATGAASGRFLQYTGSTEGVGVQTAYGIEVDLSTPYPYDEGAMLFMDYRDLKTSDAIRKEEGIFADAPSFLYAMPSTPTRVFFEETCLAARPAMPFSILKQRLQRRLDGLGVKYTAVHEEEWSYIPVGGSLPDTTQQHLAFGAAACLVHPATGYSVTRSLTEAPQYGAAIANALGYSNTGAAPAALVSARAAALQAWDNLWSLERKRQRAFMIFGLELLLQLDTAETRIFFETFFRLPPPLWRGFLASNLSSADLIVFALTTFAVAPNSLRLRLVQHLVQHSSGADLVRVYLGLEPQEQRRPSLLPSRQSL